MKGSQLDPSLAIAPVTYMAELDCRLRYLAKISGGVLSVSTCGITRKEKAIPALIHSKYDTNNPNIKRIVLIGGLSGRSPRVNLALHTVESYLNARPRLTETIALSTIPSAYPDGIPGLLEYPPTGGYYFQKVNPELRYLWRWISYAAPDFILEIQAGTKVIWEATDSPQPYGLREILAATKIDRDSSLLSAMNQSRTSELGGIPGIRLTCPNSSLLTETTKLWNTLSETQVATISPARQVIIARRSRSSLETSQILASHYGHKIDPVIYTQGVAISGRIRLGYIESRLPELVPTIESMVEHLCTDGPTSLYENADGARLAGLVWADELSEATGKARYAKLTLAAAERYLQLDDGKVPAPCHSDFGCEDMFFISTIMGRAYRHSGSPKYIDTLTRFLLEANTQQDNGLFFHCRTAPYFWGRGNGFAALGFTEALTYTPDSHPARQALLAMHRKHMKGLCEIQKPNGMWSQLLDFPGAYDELSVTCMVGYALARGLRMRWIDEKYQSALDTAWRGVNERIDECGGLTDVCTGTGFQPDKGAYLYREAISGYDDRGGSMALWFAIEKTLSSARDNQFCW